MKIILSENSGLFYGNFVPVKDVHKNLSVMCYDIVAKKPCLSKIKSVEKITSDAYMLNNDPKAIIGANPFTTNQYNEKIELKEDVASLFNGRLLIEQVSLKQVKNEQMVEIEMEDEFVIPLVGSRMYIIYHNGITKQDNKKQEKVKEVKKESMIEPIELEEIKLSKEELVDKQTEEIQVEVESEIVENKEESSNKKSKKFNKKNKK